MRKITCWLRYDKKHGVWRHNHIEFGRVDTHVRAPTPQSDEQAKSWADAKWAKTYARLNNNNKVVQESRPSL